MFINYTFTKKNTLVAKFIAIILMFLHHLFTDPERMANGINYLPLFYIHGIPIEYHLGVFGKLCVAIFMVLSGYGLYLSLSNCESEITSNLIKRISNLYKSYWKVFVFFIPLGFFLRCDIIDSDPLNLIMNFFAINTSYNWEWWFLRPFLVIIILFPITLKWINRKNSQILIDFFLIVTFSEFVQSIFPYIWGLPIFNDISQSLFGKIMVQVFELFPQFLMGCIIAKYDLFTKFRRLFKKNYILHLFSISLLIIIFYIRKRLDGDYDFIYAPLFIIASTSIIQDIKYLNTTFEILGEKSTSMWLIHSFFCFYYFQKFIYSPRISLLIILLLIVSSYCSAYIIDYIVIKISVFIKKLFS